MQAALVLALLAGTIALLISERLRPDVVSMLVLAALVALRLVPGDEAFSGFSSPATITVGCMFVVSAGLQASGVVRWIGDLLVRHGPAGQVGILLMLMATIAPLSAFINNTAAVVVFLPMILRLCNDRGISPSRILMPMVFLAILGGSCTLIGTSTNILVSSMAAAEGVRPFGLFEVTPIGLCFLAVGGAYVLVFGRLLPPRVKAEPLVESHHLDDYVSELEVLEDSPLVGKTLVEAKLGERFQIDVLGLLGPRDTLQVPLRESHRLEAGQVLLVQASAESLLDLRERTGLVVRPLHDPTRATLGSIEPALLEIVIAPESSFEGRTLQEIDFRRRYGATVLALRRPGADLHARLGRARLRVGDQLLVMADRERSLELRRRSSDFFALEERDVPVLRPMRAALATAILVGVVGVAGIGLLPIPSSAMIGAVLMVASGCLPVRRAYLSVDWKVIFLLAGVIPLGAALESSGAAAMIVDVVMKTVGTLGPHAVLGAFVVLTYALTGVMSNNATAALMVPLAVGTAAAMGIDNRPLLVGVMFAASAAFFTPFGYQTNLLVYGPGGYRFGDYTRFGGPLNLAYAVLSVPLIPVWFPFVR